MRQRRGVRGRQYAWANSLRLQRALASAEIEYRHRRDLAPSTELRQLQYAEDARQGVGKRSRQQLARQYAARYRTEILAAVDLGAFVRSLPDRGTSALLCVERDPQACHRSLITEELSERFGVAIDHLRPPDLLGT